MAEPPLRIPLSEMRVLVVDDNRAMRQILKDMMSNMGIKRRDEAEDGAKGLKMIKANRYELVLCDWVMPEMTGIEMLKAVRADPKIGDTPIIMITTQGNKVHVIEAIKCGVSEYLTKPFNFASVEDKVLRVLKKFYPPDNKIKL